MVDALQILKYFFLNLVPVLIAEKPMNRPRSDSQPDMRFRGVRCNAQPPN